jgi:hypothetical protein
VWPFYGSPIGHPAPPDTPTPIPTGRLAIERMFSPSTSGKSLIDLAYLLHVTKCYRCYATSERGPGRALAAAQGGNTY